MTERLRRMCTRTGKKLPTIQVWGGLIKKRLIKISVAVILIAVSSILLPTGKAAKEEFAKPAASPEREMPPAVIKSKTKIEDLLDSLPPVASPVYEVRAIQIQSNHVLTAESQPDDAMVKDHYPAA